MVDMPETPDDPEEKSKNSGADSLEALKTSESSQGEHNDGNFRLALSSEAVENVITDGDQDIDKVDLEGQGVSIFGRKFNTALELLQLNLSKTTGEVAKKSADFLDDISRDTAELLKTGGRTTNESVSKIPSLIQISEASRKNKKLSKIIRKYEEQYQTPANLLKYLSSLSSEDLRKWAENNESARDYFTRGAVQSYDQIKSIQLLWKSFDEATKMKLEKTVPVMIGSLEGLPWKVRDRVNRAVFNSYIDNFPKIAPIETSHKDTTQTATDKISSDPMSKLGNSEKQTAADSDSGIRFPKNNLLHKADRITVLPLGSTYTSYIRESFKSIRKFFKDEPDAKLLVWDIDSRGRFRALIAIGDVEDWDNPQDQTVYNVSLVLEGIGTGPHRSHTSMKSARNVYTTQKQVQDRYDKKTKQEGKTPQKQKHIVLGYFDTDQPGFPPSDWSVFGQAVAKKQADVMDTLLRGVSMSFLPLQRSVTSPNDPTLKLNFIAHSYGSIISYYTLTQNPEFGLYSQDKDEKDLKVTENKKGSIDAEENHEEDAKKELTAQDEYERSKRGYEPLDSIVFMGASGLPLGSNAHDLYVKDRITNPQLYVTEAKRDNSAWIGRSAWSQNQQNVLDPQFDAIIFSSDQVDFQKYPDTPRDLLPVSGHNVGTAAFNSTGRQVLNFAPDEISKWVYRDGYLSRRTTSLYNIGLITTGHSDDIIVPDTREK